ncbi:MAG: hypothetical protein COU29_01655 [Candidatus Magasanikbacteria bacterium CG10_big_fil_rev_8_21_14_0_10_36_32]|uniref:Radical SAM core domain-containing protein n=1 Tax=Candidatus Magasanikbacteria bacterium CG10_big_fil_rev_8_21_14_0_10_36_32 TaxID=1974646 RepID=A0A2M6W6P8_9BACT|nr:MAG: hypothetical protein COU29_01655 [Candidatus Magasanikbacteria bacterium CG10_big_fil_rev_8_21_14_0_10_36_32]
MFFPWNKYEELPTGRRNTLQIFITNCCNLKCDGCFARNAMADNSNISLDEYKKVVEQFITKGGQQINILGGEPLLHPNLKEMLKINKDHYLKTTIYTNGYFLNKYKKEDFQGAKLRISLYCKSGNLKSVDNLPKTDIPFEVCYMVSKTSDLEDLLSTAKELESNYSCDVFFISSIRELDNPKKEFFTDTKITMPVLEYKDLVH